MQAYDRPLLPVINHISQPQKRKRSPRAAIACESCRESKSKCDQGHPCRVCARHSLECIYRQKKSLRKNSSSSLPTRFNAARGREGSPAHHVVGRPLQPATSERRRSIAIAPQHASPHKGTSRLYEREAVDAQFSPPSSKSYLWQASDTALPRVHVSDTEQDDLSDSSNMREDEEDHLTPNGFGEINKSTNGTEFYGPTATLAFLLELRSRARTFQSQINESKARQQTGASKPREARKMSVVNFFHNADNDVSETLPLIDELSETGKMDLYPLLQDVTSPASSTMSNYPMPSHDVEKECIKLFFANLHLIYSFIDKNAFVDSCKALIWVQDPNPSKHKPPQSFSRFLALYNAVVAVGAITAGDDAVTAPKVQQFLQTRSKLRSERSNSKKTAYPPLELAQIYFAKAKALLGDLFEVCSIESTQTLFLMSIFCQYALKPHGCYMYSGMATRTASAIGLANEPDLSRNPPLALRTWWCMYYHEMEVCCSLGRETFLREPAHYAVYMGKFPDPLPIAYASSTDENVFFTRAMTALASILKRASEGIYHSKEYQAERAVTALNLDRDLLRWKADLALMFDLDDAPLTEPESVTKRKIVLKLRFYSARILIHRSFLVAAAIQGSSSHFVANIEHCLDASRQTIHLLYDTFMNRPFFRTWWYNTTYAFNAITIILYVLVSHLQKGSSEELLEEVEKSLKIFQAMDGVAVARRCAELTQEIFDVAKMSVNIQQQQAQVAQTSQTPDVARAGPLVQQIPQTNFPSQQMLDTQEWVDLDPSNMQTDFFASLVDPDILDNFGANLANMDMDLSSFENVDFFRDFAA